MGEGLHGDTPGSFGAHPESADDRIGQWPSRFCHGADPFEGILRTTRDVKITQPDGTVVYELSGVEAPDFWSDTACKIAAQKYFVNAEGKVEKSVFDMVWGVADAIAQSGRAQGYFDDATAAVRFRNDLAYLLIHQKGAFNSPVWFNVRRWHTWGIPGGPGNWGWDGDAREVRPVLRAYERPPGSACFIHTVEDNLVDDDGIADFVKKEMRLFKYGSGSGANFSRIREVNARLTPGGKASGLMSFLDVFDKAAGATKSGGTCLAPHQRVYTAEHGPVAVSELARHNDGRFIALSYDPPAGRFKAKRAQAWKSGHKLVLRVTTDKGVFELSEDHPFKLSTGEYRLARDLRPGHSLFPCSVDMQHGHLRVHLRDGRKGKEFLHRLVAGDVMGESLEGLVVHHIDENRHNNDPVNLRVFTQAEHATGHAEDRVREGTHLFQQTTYPKPGALNGMHATATFWSDEARVAKYRQAQADVLAKSGRAPEMQEYAAEQKMLNTAYRVLNAGFSIDTFESYVDGRKAVVGRIGSITKLRRQITDRFGSYAGFVQKVAEQNHRVVDVAVVGNMDVYDVEVECPTPDDKSPETGHNFVVWPTDDRTGSGVVVSNSRRAAKMVVLDMDHPEILDFIRWKVKEEKKAHALIAAGFSGGMEGEAYRTVGGQNANNSVRVTDAFMRAVEMGGTFQTKSRVDGRVCATHDARAVWREIAEAAWFCADPGVQYHDTINAWHTTPNAGPITGSNPCSEFMSLDNSACNLASLKLTAYSLEYGVWAEDDDFARACETFIVAQDILVDFSSYPTKAIAEGAHRFRQLGLGYADLGGALMANGIAYDSVEGRDFAAWVTMRMQYHAAKTSIALARRLGAFDGYAADAENVARVFEKHGRFARGLAENHADTYRVVSDAWGQLVAAIRTYGMRNAQLTLLAPTGTIGFLMDVATTGVEPILGHVQYKTLIGGGLLKLVNPLVDAALVALRYNEADRTEIRKYVETHGHVEGCAYVRPDDVDVFDAALPAGPSNRSIRPEGHILMMAAVQPFLSGAISKTINLPQSATPEDVARYYRMGWTEGLKALAIYRDGCKGAQPVTTKAAPVPASSNYGPALLRKIEPGETVAREEVVAPEGTETDILKALAASAGRSMVGDPPFKRGQRKLPKERRGTTWALKLDEHKLYVRSGEYPDGTPGEIFIDLAKEGSTLGGLAGMWAKAVSLCLQYGVPLEELVETFTYTRFEPWGRVLNHPTIKTATSIADLVMRVLAVRYLGRTDLQHVQPDALESDLIPPPTHAASPEAATPSAVASSPPPTAAPPAPARAPGDGPPCPQCGTITRRTGTCHACPQCGTSLGCS